MMPIGATTLRNLLARFARDQRGTTAIEYALVAAGIGAVVSGAVFTLGGDVKTKLYDRIATIL